MFCRKSKQWFILKTACLVFVIQMGQFSYGQQPRFQHFTSDQGLSENVVYSIIQDKKGFLWIGTWDGLNRYDGYRFKKFYHKASDTTSVAGNTIFSLYEDEDGTIWIGTNGGLCRYDPLTGKFSKAFRFQNSINGNVMRITPLSTTELLIQTFNGIYCFNTRSREGQPVPVEINGKVSLFSNLGIPYKNDKGQTCLADSKGLLIYNSVRKIFQPDNARFFNSLSWNKLNISHMAIDKKKQYWIASNDGKILIADSAGNFLPLSSNDLLRSLHNIQCMYNDPDGNMWVGTEKGLVQHEITSGEFSYYNEGNGLSSSVINCVFKDQTGIIWIGTLNGLNKLIPRPKKFGHLKASAASNGLYNDFILGIEPEGSEKFRIHYSQGILHFTRYDLRSNTTRHFAKQEYDKKSYIREVVIKNSRLLSASTLQYFEDLLLYSKDISYLLPPILIADSTDKLWYATVNSFGYYAKGDGTGFVKKEISPFNGEIYDMRMVGPCLWMATAADGLVCYNSKNGTLAKHTTDLSTDGSISSNEVLCFLPEKNGNIWVGTKGGGLNYFEADSQKFIHYTMEQGLCNNTIYCMVKDAVGFLWLGTSNGLSRFDPVNKTFRNYSQADGLVNSEFNRYSAVMTTDDHLWFGGINGIDHFNPADLKTDSKTPAVSITGIKIFDQDIQPTASISLSNKENYITFEFAVMDFRNPSGNKFAYQLAGIDKGWVNADNRNFVSYSNLKPGHYRFLLKGSNHEGIWVNEPLGISFIIRPHWTATAWFYAACAIALAGILYALYVFRIRQLKKVMALRTKISQDLHDEVGSTLSGIALYSSLARKQLDDSDKDKAEKSLSVIEQTATGMVDKLNDIVWAVNPQNDNLFILLKRLEDYAYEMATARNIEVLTQIDEQAKNISLPMDFRRNIYLVFKESINNAVKYAACSTLSLKAEQSDHSISFEIADNGKGFEPSTVKKGNGLNNIKNRAQEIHAQLEIHSQTNKGTRIRLICKIPRQGIG